MPEQTQEPESIDPKKNHLLARLQPEDYDALMLVAKIVPLETRQTGVSSRRPHRRRLFPHYLHVLTARHRA